MTDNKKILSKWARYCKRHGLIYKQPLTSEMDIDGDFVILQNCNGVLARYNMVTGKFSLPEEVVRKKESAIYDKAMKALIKFHDDNPDVYDEYGRYQGQRLWIQPARELTRITWKYVYFSNINGLLAKYNRRTKEIII